MILNHNYFSRLEFNCTNDVHYSVAFLEPPRPECTDNSECPNDKACINLICTNPCELDSCGVNSNCFVQNHRAVCTCKDGFVGNPQHQCIESKCKDKW